ncbi:MAG: choice-of-anchor J domain-containing protein [Bacteroidales bacterium]|nr:choice-of-anchor J domain-containing protein [Bacteroidales bacterium]
MKTNLFLFKVTSLYLVIYLVCGFLDANPQDSTALEHNEMNFYELQEAFYNYWEPYDVSNGYYYQNGERLKAFGWKQFKRWEWFWESRVNPETGEFPEKLRDEYFTEKQIKGGAGPKEGDDSWTSLGPSSTPGGYHGLGRLNCIAFREGDENTFYVGSPSGGLWKTTDGGSSWGPLTDDNPVLGVSDAVVIPGATPASDIVYIATGDRDVGFAMQAIGSGQVNENNSIGVMVSSDGGTTWESTGLSFDAADKTLTNRLLLDPNNNSILYAATSLGAYKTIDGGTTWAQISEHEFIDMEFKPDNSSVIFGSTRVGGKIYRTTDGGGSWTEQLDVFGGHRTELAVTPANPSRIYAVVTDGYSSSVGLEAVFRSDNMGDSFTDIYEHPTIGNTNHNLLQRDCNPNAQTGGQGHYDLAIAADPNDADIVYVGGINTWKSTDGGDSFAIVNHWSTTCGGTVETVHADKHALAFRGSTSILFECNDGGLYKTENGGTNWTHLGDGLVTSQIYRLGLSALSSNELISGLQDNGTKAMLSGTWTDVLGGDGMECIIDFKNNNIQYGSLQNGKLYRSTDHWSNSTLIHLAEGAWVTPFIMDPVSSSTLYVGYNTVLKSGNQGSSWSVIGYIDGSNGIRSLTIAPSDPNYIYAAFLDVIYQTTTGGDSWTNITAGLPVATSNITYITIDEDDPNTIWVSMGEYNEHGVYQSTDGGSTWTNISTGLPEVPVMCVIQNMNNDAETELYAATDIGVYQKVEVGDWVDFSSGLPNVVVTELEIYYDNIEPDDSKLRAATYGRGLWESPLPPAQICRPPTDLLADNIGVYSARLNWTSAGASRWNIEYGLDGYELGEGTLIEGVGANPYSLSGLDGNTAYDFYIQSDCEDATGMSEWAGPASFTTIREGLTCEFSHLITALPFSLSDHTTENSENDYNMGNGANTCGTGYMEGEDYVFEFTPDNDVFLDVTISNNTDPTGIFIQDGCPDDPETSCIDVNYSIDGNPSLSAVPLTGKSTYFLIVSTGGEVEFTTFDILLEEVICPDPSSIIIEEVTGTTATLSWTTGSSALWNIEYGPGGFAHGEGTLLEGIVDNPYTITGLDASTAYDVYVQDDCGGGETSNWAGPQSFMTTELCPSPSMPMVNSTTYTTAELSWDQPAGTSAWDIEWGVSDFTLGEGTLVTGITEVPYELTGLSPGTTYKYYVRSNCTTSGNGVGEWYPDPMAMPVTFTTTSPLEAPLSEHFENGGSIPSDWTQENISASVDWTFQNGGHDGNPPNAAGGSYNAFLFAEEAGDHQTRLITPLIDVTSMGGMVLSFMHTQAAWTGQDELSVYYRPSLDDEWILLPSATWTETIESWTKEMFALPGASSTYQFAFEGNASYGHGVCIDMFKIDIPMNMEWMGDWSCDWNYMDNWMGAECPGALDNVYIASWVANQPEINANVACNNLEIESSAQVTLLPEGTLTTNGTLTMHGDDGILIQSNATGTGSLITNGDISGAGNLQVQRHIPAYTEDAGWHFLSSPVDVQAICNGFVDNSDPLNPIPGMNDFYKWYEPTNMWINTKNDGGFWNDDFEDNFIVGCGYLVAYEGIETKTFTGSPNASNLTLNAASTPPLTYTPGEGDGWNLVGNPFPAAIDWDELTKTNIDDAVYTYDGEAGQYKSWNGSAGSFTDGIIPPMNGFFIKANGDPSLTIPKSARLHSSTGFYKSAKSSRDVLKLTISGNGFSDETYICFSHNGSKGFDHDGDAYKLYGAEDAPQLYSIIPEEILSINVLPYANECTIPIGLEVGAEKNYVLTWNDSFYETVELSLDDLRQNKTINLNQRDHYTCSASPGDEPDRFLLHVTGATGMPNTLQHGAFKIYNHKDLVYIKNRLQEKASIEIYNLVGQLITSKQINGAGTYTISMQGHSGFYVVRAQSLNHYQSKKIIIK